MLVQQYLQARGCASTERGQDLADSVSLHSRHLRPSRQGIQGLDRI